MKRVIYTYTLLVFAILSFTGCKKWLDVKPEDKFIEDQLYSSPQGFTDALNGLYINNGTNALYGATLTATTIDVLAQLYLVNGSNSEYTMSTYNYADNKSKAKIDGIWTNMYLNITNVNKFIENLDKRGSVLDAKTLGLYKGEAYGLRAFYYFDLMRMFTKAYVSDSTQAVLPYYDKVTYQFTDFSPNNYIMQKVLGDLKTAEDLLAVHDDAVTQTRVSKVTATYGRDSRNYRMNYYAIKALQARVNLWKGDKVTALAAAKMLIANQAKFPWTVLADLNTAVSNKTFATEMIMGVENPKLNDLYDAVFNPTLFDESLLAPNTSGTFINTTVFEGVPTDYRSQYVWKVAGRAYPTFFKYQDGPNPAYNFYRTVPLIRMGEMYLIAAECEPDNALALDNLNTLRLKRNIAALPITTTPAALITNIMKEYRREFYGEGQLFYYYKRTQTVSVIAGASNASMTISPASYVFPVPLSETTPR
jgi:hypothetical protein